MLPTARASATAWGHEAQAGPRPFAVPPTPTVNTLAVIVDAGPSVGTPPAPVGAVNRPYVTVKVCVPGSTTCANIDHVLLDTGSWGLRLVRSVLTADGVTLTPSAGGAAAPHVDIVPETDTLVVFPSWMSHEVLPVRVPSGAWIDRRFTINCWIHRVGPVAGQGGA